MGNVVQQGWGPSIPSLHACALSANSVSEVDTAVCVCACRLLCNQQLIVPVVHSQLSGVHCGNVECINI